MGILRMLSRMLGLAVIVTGVTFVYPLIPINYHAYVQGPMKDTAGHLQHMYNLAVYKMSDSNDTVTIHINSPGGLAKWAVSQIKEIKQTKAYVISINEGRAASAAALIAMAADEKRALTNTYYLFHRPYIPIMIGSMMIGKKIDIPNSYVIDAIDIYMNKVVFPYLTKAQSSGYTSGQDIWIKSKVLFSQIKNERTVLIKWWY